MRRALRLGCLVVLVVCGQGGRASAFEKVAPPNVLFIMADDFRFEPGVFPENQLAPNLHRLAKKSLLFERAYCQQAVCNPSRSSMLTGRRPDSLGIWCNGIHFREKNPDIMTLPLWFKQHGYVTRDVGKIFHNWHTKEHGDPRSWSGPEFLHFANHGDDKPQVDGEAPKNLISANRCERVAVSDEAYYDGRVANEAVRVLKEISSQRFFSGRGLLEAACAVQCARPVLEANGAIHDSVAESRPAERRTGRRLS